MKNEVIIMILRKVLFILIMQISNYSYASDYGIEGSTKRSHPEFNNGEEVVMEFKRVVTGSDGSLMTEAEGQYLPKKGLLVTSNSIISVTNEMIELSTQDGSKKFRVTPDTIFCDGKYIKKLSDYNSGELVTIVTKWTDNSALSVRSGGMLFALGQYSGATASDYDCREIAKNNAKKMLVSQAQQLLNEAGYDAGSVDGIAGSKTIRAIKGFQRDNGYEVTGNVSEELINQLLDISAIQ